MSLKSMINTVENSIARYGSDAELQTHTLGAIDFDTGIQAKVVTTKPLRGVVSAYMSNEVVEGVINADDLKFTVRTAQGVKGENVLLDGVLYAIMNDSTLLRNNTVVKHTLQLRKGV